MNLFKRLGAPATAVAAAAIFGALTTGGASAGEFCRQDVTGHMLSCSYSSMEQCQATAAGLPATCVENPYFARAQTPRGAYRQPRSAY